MKRRFGLAEVEANADGPLIGTRQVADLLCMTTRTVRDLANEGDLRGVQVGRWTRITWHSLRAYLYRTRVLPLREDERKGMENAGTRREAHHDRKRGGPEPPRRPEEHRQPAGGRQVPRHPPPIIAKPG
jgi:excisionase family DNA binding protein